MLQSIAVAAELKRQIDFQQQLKQHLDLALVDGVVALLSIQLREIEQKHEADQAKPVEPSIPLTFLNLDHKTEANLVNLLMAVVTADGLTKTVELRRIREYFQRQLRYTEESLQRVDGLLQEAQEREVEQDIFALARPFLLNPTAERFAIYSVCAEIAFADDEVGTEEQELLAQLAQLFQIDAARLGISNEAHRRASDDRRQALESKFRGQYPLDSPIRFGAFSETRDDVTSSEGQQHKPHSQLYRSEPIVSQTWSSVSSVAPNDGQSPPFCKYCGRQASKLHASFCNLCGQLITNEYPAEHTEITSEAEVQQIKLESALCESPQLMGQLLEDLRTEDQASGKAVLEAVCTLEVCSGQCDDITQNPDNQVAEVVELSDSTPQCHEDDWMARAICKEVLALQADISKIADSWRATSLVELKKQAANRPKGMSSKSWTRLATFLEHEERQLGVVDGGFIPWTPEWGLLCARVYGIVSSGSLDSLADLSQVVHSPPPHFREAQRMALIKFLERIAEVFEATFSPSSPDPEPMAFTWSAAEFTKQLTQYLQLHLKERHWQIFSARFGLDGQAVQTLEELGSALGVTRERIRQIEGNALKLVRSLTARNRDQPVWRDVLSLAQQRFWSAAALWKSLFLLGLQREVNQPTVDLILWLEGLSYFEPASGMSDGLYFKDVPMRHISLALSSIRSFFRDHNEEIHSLNKVAQALSLDRQLVAALLQVTTFVETAGEDLYATAFSALNRPEQVYRVLRDLGEPTHYETITKIVEERDGTTGGVGLRTVTNYMVGDERFVCQGRSGFWGLAAWGVESRGVRELMAEALHRAGTPLSSNAIYERVSAFRPVSPRSITAYLHQDGDMFFRCGLDEWGLKTWEVDPNYADRFDLQIRDLLAEFTCAECSVDFPLHEAASFISRRTGMSSRSARAVLIWSPYLTIWREGWRRSHCRFHPEPKATTRGERNRRVPTQQNIFDTFLTDEVFCNGPGQELPLRELVKIAEEQLGYPPHTTYTLVTRSELLEKIERDGARFCRLTDIVTS